MSEGANRAGRARVDGNVLLLQCERCRRPLLYAGRRINIDHFVFDAWPPSSVYVTRGGDLAIQGSGGEAWTKFDRGTWADPRGTYSITCRCGHGPFQVRSERLETYWREYVADARTRVVRAVAGVDL